MKLPLSLRIEDSDSEGTSDDDNDKIEMLDCGKILNYQSTNMANESGDQRYQISINYQ